jgi:hypothetical protein
MLSGLHEGHRHSNGLRRPDATSRVSSSAACDELYEARCSQGRRGQSPGCRRLLCRSASPPSTYSEPQDPCIEHALRIPAVSSRVTCRTNLTHNPFDQRGKYDE